MLAPARLDWIPMGSPRLRPPVGLRQWEEGAWWRLLWAMFDQGEPQGYLAVTPDIWILAGSRDHKRWHTHASRLMATFETANIAGQHVIFFPPLIDVIKAQQKKVRNHRLRYGERELSLSLDFDVGSKRKKGSHSQRCAKHPDSGLTPWGSCYGCYAEKYAVKGGTR
jgi:hypothetical protein